MDRGRGWGGGDGSVCGSPPTLEQGVRPPAWRSGQPASGLVFVLRGLWPAALGGSTVSHQSSLGARILKPGTGEEKDASRKRSITQNHSLAPRVALKGGARGSSIVIDLTSSWDGDAGLRRSEVRDGGGVWGSRRRQGAGVRQAWGPRPSWAARRPKSARLSAADGTKVPSAASLFRSPGKGRLPG